MRRTTGFHKYRYTFGGGAYTAGVNAFVSGISKQNNPHDQGTNAFNKWLDGWGSAEMEDRHAHACAVAGVYDTFTRQYD